MAQLNAGSNNEYIASWNKALTDKTESLPSEELQEYQEAIKKEAERRNQPTSKAEILRSVTLGPLMRNSSHPGLVTSTKYKRSSLLRFTICLDGNEGNMEMQSALWQ